MDPTRQTSILVRLGALLDFWRWPFIFPVPIERLTCRSIAVWRVPVRFRRNGMFWSASKESS